MTARERILSRVRSALGDRPPIGAPIAAAPRVPPGDLLAAFRERLLAVAGECTVLADREDLGSVVATRLHAAAATTVALGGGEAMRMLGQDLARRGFTILPPEISTADLAAVDAGVTAAQWGIAETGTLVLDDGAVRARRASLLPPLHIAILPRTHLVATLDEVFAGPVAASTAASHALTLITGPSRTADIELQLVVGVHGPKHLLVVLV